MYIQPYESLKHTVRPDGVEMTDFFDKLKGLPGSDGVAMGLGVFPPGMEAPPAAHEQDEYGFVLKGQVGVKIGGQVFRARENEATFIPAGEEHISFNDSDEESRVVWMLVSGSKNLYTKE